jgi:hypothetical protein
MPERGSRDKVGDGNTQCQAQLSAARGYFRASASGMATPGTRRAPSRRQVGEKAFDFSRPHRPRMSQTMEADESAHPEQVGLLGTEAVVAITDSLPHLVEQTGRSQRGSRAGFHGSLNTPCDSCIGTQFFDVSAVYVFSDRPGYSSRARLFVMTCTSKSS